MKLFRSRCPDPGPVKIIIQQGVGRIAGYELADGTIIKVKPYCENPAACTKDACWASWPRKPWWMGA